MTTPTPTATPTGVAGRAVAAVSGVWERLAQQTRTSTTFDPSMVAGLPEAARRWLTHAIAPSTPLHRPSSWRWSHPARSLAAVPGRAAPRAAEGVRVGGADPSGAAVHERL
jgi:hypothetical protein